MHSTPRSCPRMGSPVTRRSPTLPGMSKLLFSMAKSLRPHPSPSALCPPQPQQLGLLLVLQALVQQALLQPLECSPRLLVLSSPQRA